MVDLDKKGYSGAKANLIVALEKQRLHLLNESYRHNPLFVQSFL